MNHTKLTNDLSWAMRSEIAGTVAPAQLAQCFEQLARAVHRSVDAVPYDPLVMADPLGLSPAWIIGHLALLTRSVLESFGGVAAGKLPAGFSNTFGPGRDGSEVHDVPENLIELFDGEVEALSAFLRFASPSLLSETPRHDDFGLLALMPHDSLRSHAAAAIRYAGIYVMELSMLCNSL